MPQTVTVWCYAHGRPGAWEALCVDLDIAVQGRSFDEVKDRLNAAVKSYVEDACQEAPEDAARLLRRRAPLHVRARFFFNFLWHAITPKSDQDREFRAGFDLPCPA